MNDGVFLVTLGYVSGLRESHIKNSLSSIQILSFGTSRITSNLNIMCKWAQALNKSTEFVKRATSTPAMKPTNFP